MNKDEFESVISELKQWGNVSSSVLYFEKKVCLMNNWPYAEIWSPNNDQKFMIWSGHWSNNEEYFEKYSKFSSFFKFSKGIGLIGQVWQQKKLLWINDLYNDKNFLRADLAVKCKLNSAISFPIIHNEKVILILCFFLEKISEVDIHLAEEIFSYSLEVGEIIQKFNINHEI